MAEPQFTPAPWHFVNGELRRVRANKSIVCGVHRIGRFVGKENDDEQIANGHLIAAAPELYEALNNLAAQIALMAGRGIALTVEVERALDVAGARLAKARGEA